MAPGRVGNSRATTRLAIVGFLLVVTWLRVSQGRDGLTFDAPLTS